MDASASSAREGRRQFGVFEFDLHTGELSKDGRLVALRPQAHRLLALLIASAGEVVSRAEIQRALWSGDTFVDFDQGVNHAIRELRAALGDVAEAPRFIQTLPRRGYRFVAPVSAPDSTLPSPMAASPPGVADAPSSPGASGRSRTRERWLAGAAGMVLTGALAVGFFLLRTSAGADPTPPRILAIRPFVMSSADPAAGIGLADAIAARLGGQQALPIQRGRAGDPADGAAATHVLSGEVTRDGTDVVVVARLADVPAGVTLWVERLRVHPGALFNAENVIAERVVAALRLRLAAAEQDRLRRRYTSNGTAYEEYLRGRSALVKYTPDGTRRAIESFERALVHDRGYVLARAGLAMACADMCLRYAPAAEVEAWGNRAEAEARAALAADDALAEAHLARAAVARKREFDWNATLDASGRALVLDPNLDQAYFFRAAAYYHLGYMEEALIELEKGRRLKGADLVEPMRIDALVALFSGQFAPARARLEEVSRLSSRPIGDTYLALAYHYSGNSERARAMLESLAAQPSASTSARAGVALAGVLAAQGDHDGARRQVDQVLTRPYRDHHVAYGLGAAYAQLGDTARATHWLRIAADTGFPCVPWFERDPWLEPLRRRPTYAELLAYVRGRRDTSLSADRR
jgi:DNA-binding winged helix-turn-helix (wHTH) protein/tetratricopeptide (TPR) repeat protein